MEKTNIKIVRYEYGSFWIDVVEQNGEYEAWLTHKDYGVSDLMFGLNKEIGMKHFLSVVESIVDKFIKSYCENYIP